MPGALEKEALLRVHRQRFARRDAEEGGVEGVDVFNEPALEVAGTVGVGSRARDGGKLPDPRRPATDQIPVLVRVVRARKLARQGRRWRRPAWSTRRRGRVRSGGGGRGGGAPARQAAAPRSSQPRGRRSPAPTRTRTTPPAEQRFRTASRRRPRPCSSRRNRHPVRSASGTGSRSSAGSPRMRATSRRRAPSTSLALISCLQPCLQPDVRVRTRALRAAGSRPGQAGRPDGARGSGGDAACRSTSWESNPGRIRTS